MVALVLDASVVLAVALQEANRHHAARILSEVADQGAAVPCLWHVEVGNALPIAERRKAMPAEQRAAALQDLSQLTVTVDTETVLRAWREAISLAAQYRVTLYDAMYLELSLRRELPLASFDADLRRAATAANVPLL
jgi:predicted nucleic acid-binding protein